MNPPKPMDTLNTLDDSVKSVNGFPKLTEFNLNRIVKGRDKNGYILVRSPREVKQLQKQLVASRFFWLPIISYYREQGNTTLSVEKFFIVYPMKRTGEEVDFDSFVKELTDSMLKADTMLAKYPDASSEYVPIKDDIKLKFTYTKTYLCKQPDTIMEAHRRASMGELVVYGFYE